MSEDLAYGEAERGHHLAHRGEPAVQARQLAVITDEAVSARLSVIGRTEDVAVSPRGDRLALACFAADRIALIQFGIERDPERDAPSAVLLSSIVMVECEHLSSPHGLAFVDDRTLLVANRDAELVAVRVPAISDDRPLVRSPGHVLLGRGSAVPLQAPGSLAVLDAGGGLMEVLVCDNDRHVVSRHVIDMADDWAVLDSEELLHHRLAIPDGVTVSPSGEWLAVSNHNTNEVFVYRYDTELGPGDDPGGVLEGPNFPHGLRFDADSHHLLVADAGLPYVHTYAAADGDWRGRRRPVRTTRVMDDSEFLAGKHNPQEGGPKGLETIAGVVVVTSEHQALAFYDIADLGCDYIAHGDSAIPAAVDRVVTRVVGRARADTASVRAELEQLRQHSQWQNEVVCERDRTIGEMAARIAEVEARLALGRADADQMRDELARLAAEIADERRDSERSREAIERLESSTSWKLTRPMRAVADRVKRGV